MARQLAPWLVALIAATVFWLTAYPTITWWDSGSYWLAAATLGVTSPPGSMLATLLGWPIATIVPNTHVAHALNLFAGVLAAGTVSIVYLAALQLEQLQERTHGGRSAIALATGVGALAFAFNATLWEHAIKYTPYVLTAVFTGLILLVLLRWWRDAERPDAWRWIFLVTLLLGIDFSVHRTNALLIPGAIAWITVRSPRTLITPRPIVAAFIGLAIGLSLHLLVIPISANTDSPLNFFPPHSLRAFWDYVSLAPYGGGFLLDLLPRKSPFIGSQLRDVLVVVRDAFMPDTWLGVLPALLVVVGVFALWRQRPRVGLAFTLLVLLQVTTTVAYFNIPANYFRPFDRHYLPILMTVGVLTAYGAGVVISWAANSRRAHTMVTATSALLLLAPATQLVANWHNRDASNRWFAYDYARNSLEGLPPDAIYFTVGDNDTFPVMYVQAVEGVRTDVQIINMSLANTEWFVERLRQRNPTFPLSMSASERSAAQQAVWADSAFNAPGNIPGTTHRLVPRSAYGDNWLPSDVVLYDIVRTNAWRRPLAFSVTMGDNGAGWLSPLAQPQGLYWMVWPSKPDSVHDLLATNLLERYRYRGYSDSTVVMEPESRTMGVLYLTGFRELISREAARDGARCREVVAKMEALLPPARLEVPPDFHSAVVGSCG